MIIIERLKLLIFDVSMSFRGYKKEHIQKIQNQTDKRIKVFPRCPICKNVMVFRCSRLSYPPYRDDVAFKCCNCFHTLHQGFPITKKEYLDGVNLRQGRSFMSPSAPEKNRKYIKNRLKDLGYLET